MNIATCAGLCLAVFLSACAATVVSRNVHLKPVLVESESWGDNYAVDINCPDELQSFAISPVIPLPPVIPGGFIDDDRSIVLVQTPHDSWVTMRILDSAGRDQNLSRQGYEYTGDGEAKTQNATWTFNILRSCENLDGLSLIFDVRRTKGPRASATYKLQYSEEDATFAAGYIRQ